MTWLPAPYLPVPVTDALLAFPGQVEHLMPAPEEIPERYWEEDARLFPLIRKFVYEGYMPADFTFEARDEIDYGLVHRHMAAIRGSFQPKHEHKIAALTMLLDLWLPNLKPIEEAI